MKYPFLSSVAFLVLIGADVAASQTVRHQPEARFLLEAMLEQRLMLESGVYRIERGHSVEESRDQPDDKVDGPFSIFCAFDKDRLRFDRTETTNFGFRQDVDDNGRPVFRPGDEPRRELTAKYFRTLERSAHWIVGQPLITYSKPTKPSLTRPFDVRGVGIYTDGDLQNALRIRELINSILDSKQSAAIEAKKEGMKLLTLSIGESSTDSGSRYKIWIDILNGFTPVKAEMTAKVRGEWQVTLTQETKWEKRQNVWVPVSNKMDSRTILGETHSVQEFNIRWEAVNSPIDDSLFTYESFGAREPFGVVDDSTGKLITIKPEFHSGMDNSVINEGNTARRWLIAMNVILVMLLSIILLMRVLRDQRNRLSE